MLWGPIRGRGEREGNTEGDWQGNGEGGGAPWHGGCQGALLACHWVCRNSMYLLAEAAAAHSVQLCPGYVVCILYRVGVGAAAGPPCEGANSSTITVKGSLYWYCLKYANHKVAQPTKLYKVASALAPSVKLNCCLLMAAAAAAAGCIGCS